MGEERQEPEQASADPGAILKCGACNRTFASSKGEVASYAISGWPQCCGETMSLFIEVPLPEGPGS
jgi:hypothetical protein